MMDGAAMSRILTVPRAFPRRTLTLNFMQNYRGSQTGSMIKQAPSARTPSSVPLKFAAKKLRSRPLPAQLWFDQLSVTF